MSEQSRSRRSVLRGIGTAAAAGAVVGTASNAAAATGWESVETPVETNLHDVAVTAEGAYAVGGDGDVIARTSEGWTQVLDGGPTGNSNGLNGAAVTDDGERLWFVGNSGAIGEYDVTTSSLVDHSAPNDVTNNFNAVSVEGTAGDANVYVAGDSGKIYYSFENGETGTWNQVTPGSGSEVNAIDTYGPRAGHAVDGNKTVFQTDDGSTYEKLGVEDANVNFHGVDSDGADAVYVSGGNGVVYDWDGSQWTRTDLGDATLRDIEAVAGEVYAVGGGGKVFSLVDGVWSESDTPTGANLEAFARGVVDIAVGASGTVIEN
ncbi:MAG: WD40/YVTN/BNR-like repeat-containing protein [Halolamina sp.]